MKVVVVIPARYGSSRFPGKPLAVMAGKPMIQWVYEGARQVREVAEVWVATDDSRIAACVQGFGGQVQMTRGDHPSGTDRLAEAARNLNLEPEDIVVNIQGDQPVFAPQVAEQVIKALKEDGEAVMATPICPLADPVAALSPHVVKVVFDRRGYALYFSRAPIPFWRDNGGQGHYFKHIGIYGYRAAYLQRFVKLPPGKWEEAEKLEQLRVLEHGGKIKVVLVTAATVEVDVPEDMAKVEEYLRR